MYKLGIDIGIYGALAFLDTETVKVELYDMPVMAKSNKKQMVNAAELSNIIEGHPGFTAYVELVNAMPGQGVSSVFSFGMSYGIVLGVLAALGVPMVLITPAVWKKRAGLIGKDKNLSRTLAQQLYPKVELGQKKDIGRAEALLIARFS